MGNNSSQNGFVHKFYRDIMPMVYGFGAAIVIIGAMFKLLNLSGASVMLAAGLTTEAILFILGIFEPKHKEFDWFKVYPELDEDSISGSSGVALTQARLGGMNSSQNLDSISISSKLDEIFAKANIDSNLIDRLGNGMSKIADYAGNMASFVEVSSFSDKYCSSLSKASSVLDQVSFAHEKLSGALNALSNISDNGEQYNSKMTNIIGTLDEIGQSYKKELEGVEKRLYLMNTTYESVVTSMSNLEVVGDETIKFKEELANLSLKFESLNKIYGNMLNALKV
jgi:gliding motility-associated protein GldL